MGIKQTFKFEYFPQPKIITTQLSSPTYSWLRWRHYWWRYCWSWLARGCRKSWCAQAEARLLRSGNISACTRSETAGPRCWWQQAAWHSDGPHIATCRGNYNTDLYIATEVTLHFRVHPKTLIEIDRPSSAIIWSDFLLFTMSAK